MSRAAVDLFREGKPEKALSLLTGKRDPESLFLTVSAFLALGRLEEAHSLFFANRDAFFELHPVQTIEADFEFRFLKREFAAAYRDIDYFNEKPYVSQEVEEKLRCLPRLVESNVAALSAESQSGDELLASLSSKDDYVALSALSRLKPREAGENALPAVRSLVLDGKRASDLRAYALLFLKAAADRQKILYKGLELIPAALPDPFKEPSRLRAIELLGAEKDVGVARLAIELLDQAVLSAYPHPYPGRGVGTAVESLLKRARRLLGAGDDGEKTPADRRLDALLDPSNAIK